MQFKRAVAALCAAVVFSLPCGAQDASLDDLFAQLARPDLPNWKMVEQEIWQEWSRSGSPTADFLLERGRDALEAEDAEAAIAHLTALVDHAPDFAEGYNARATAYYQADLYGPALSDIRVALALNPRHFGAMIGLATILEQIGQPRDALTVYRAVSAIHPHRPDVEEAIERLKRQSGASAL